MRDWLLTEVDSFSTFPQLSVATTRWKSFKVIHGQVDNLRRFCFYFAMMICCCWWISILQGHLGTGGEPKEKLFLLCDDDPLLQTDASPSNKFMDRSRTEGETDSTLGWWSVLVIRCHCEYAIQQSHHICLFTYANCLLNTCAFRLKIYYLFVYLFKLTSYTAVQVTMFVYLLLQIVCSLILCYI